MEIWETINNLPAEKCWFKFGLRRREIKIFPPGSLLNTAVYREPEKNILVKKIKYIKSSNIFVLF